MYTVITPIGNIYVDTASEARFYNETYGYHYVRTYDNTVR